MSWAKQRKTKTVNRDAGGFIALPWSVVDSRAYRMLSHTGRSLLIEIARQLAPYGANNGMLVASRKFMKARGWNSADVLYRARDDLVEKGFIHETVKGHRPNKASWYAVTWVGLAGNPKFDFEATGTFRRGSYADPPIAPRRGECAPDAAERTH